MKYLGILVTVAIAVTAVAAVDPECAYEKLKECNTLESLIAHKKWPKTIADVTNVCGLLKDGDACVHAFNERCVKKPKALKVANDIHANLVKYYDDICGTDKGKQDFLDRVQQCYSKPTVVSNFTIIHQRYVALAERLAITQDISRLPEYCCSILYFRDAGKAVNVKECGYKIADYLDRVLKQILQDPFHEVCGDDTSYVQCVKEKLPSVTQEFFNNIINSKPPFNNKYQNALPTLYQIFNEYFKN